MLKIFTLKYEEKSESFNDSIMSNFLADKEILRWESNFFERKNEYFWTVLVEYRQSFSALSEPTSRTGKIKDESYKEMLTDNDWPLFKMLREWRSELSKEEGVPPYVICNNMQLARITVLRPASLNALQTVDGIGKAKIEKYGKVILQKIASFGQSVGDDIENNDENDSKEDTD